MTTDFSKAYRRSEEHTSELQSLAYLVCSLLLEKKKKLKLQTKADMTHVRYKGAGPAFKDLLGAHVACFFSCCPAAIALVFFLAMQLPPRSTLFPYTTLFR